MLHHYIVVRRDLPVGAVLAQVAHAAGESFYAFALRHPGARTARCANYFPAFRGSSEKERPVLAGGSEVQVLPAEPTYERVSMAEVEQALGAQADPPFDPSRTVAVVLGARNEHRLLKLASHLRDAGVAHVVIREVDGVYAGQLTAIGIEPAPKESITALVRDFHMFPTDGADQPAHGEAH